MKKQHEQEKDTKKEKTKRYQKHVKMEKQKKRKTKQDKTKGQSKSKNNGPFGVCGKQTKIQQNSRHDNMGRQQISTNRTAASRNEIQCTATLPTKSLSSNKYQQQMNRD